MSILKGYVGTYTKKNSKGIYSFEFCTLTNSIENISLEFETDNPTYLNINNNILTSVTTKNSIGGIELFKIKKNSLELLDSFLYEGKGPCYVEMKNNLIFSSNYHMKRFDILNIIDNAISYSNSTIINTLNNPNIHCIKLNKENTFFFVINLGSDSISIYDKNTFNHIKDINLKPNTRPRHIIFNKYKDIFYLITEGSGELYTFSYKDLDIDLLQIDSLISNKTEPFEGSAIHISPCNKFIYTSERKYNTISVFHLDSVGIPRKIKEYNNLGINNPRDFNISPCGNYIFICSYLKDNIKVFRLDKKNGLIKDLICTFNIPEPVCLKFK